MIANSILFPVGVLINLPVRSRLSIFDDVLLSILRAIDNITVSIPVVLHILCSDTDKSSQFRSSIDRVLSENGFNRAEILFQVVSSSQHPIDNWYNVTEDKRFDKYLFMLIGDDDLISDSYINNRLLDFQKFRYDCYLGLCRRSFIFEKNSSISKFSISINGVAKGSVKSIVASEIYDYGPSLISIACYLNSDGFRNKFAELKNFLKSKSFNDEYNSTLMLPHVLPHFLFLSGFRIVGADLDDVMRGTLYDELLKSKCGKSKWENFTLYIFTYVHLVEIYKSENIPYPKDIPIFRQLALRLFFSEIVFGSLSLRVIFKRTLLLRPFNILDLWTVSKGFKSILKICYSRIITRFQ